MPTDGDADLDDFSETASSASDAARPEAFRFPRLRAAETLEDFKLHVAALEWSLDAPITIRGEADIQSKRQWADLLKPFAHQIENLLTFCRRAPVALLADDVGLGKTISAGLILSELMDRKKVARTLVVAPKLLLPQWQEELATKFRISAEIATGAQLRTAVARRMPVVVCTYHSLRSHLNELRDANFDMIILDEAHKLRNLHGTAQAPEFALSVKRALQDRVFKYVLMLTATPIQNRLWDLYSLIDLLTAARGHTNPLGSPASFKANYIGDARAAQIRPGRREVFRQHLSNYIVRTRRTDVRLTFPTRRVRTYRVEASAVELRLLALVGSLFRDRGVNGLSQSSIGQALMSSPQALASQLETMSVNGTVPRDIARSVASLVTPDLVSSKLTGLVALIAELSSQRPDDWRLVVFTSRARTQEAIARHLRALRIPTGLIAGSRASENERSIRAFKEDPPGVRVLVSTDAGAEGINLQVANVLVNFDLPWNPMVLEQRIGRIQRLASTHAEVTVLNLVLAGSVEETVVARLSQKLQAISESLGDLEGILESADREGDGDDSFEAMIRRLVVDSLKGIDVEKATRLALTSIETAKAMFEKERDTVEQTLGDLRNLHRTGPLVPEITPLVPSVDSKEFVFRALTRDGATFRPLPDDVLSVTIPGQNDFRITFTDRAFDGDEEQQKGFFTGNAPRLYLPGKRDFERLAQSWVERAGSLIVDRSRLTNEEIERALVSWLADRDDLSLADFNASVRREGFAGELTCKASVAVAHDRLEKLVTVPIRGGHADEVDPPADGEVASPSECDTSRLGNGLSSLVRAAIDAEPDLIKFSTFYRDRLAEELRAAGDPALQRRVREQFAPIAAADAVGVRGVRFALLNVSARLHIDGEGPYPADFTLLPISATAAQVTPIPRWITCDSSGRSVPASATDFCAISGQRVLFHLMDVSVVSGRRALRQHMYRCEATGVALLPDETEVCSVTGHRVRKGLLATSAVSGRSALPSEFATCEITGASVLPDELIESSLSGRKFRSDQVATSTMSGCVGHISEFVQSVLPEGTLARFEAEQSDVSGAWAALGRLAASEKPPGRRGLPSETVRCEATGQLVLIDEVDRSDISGRPALTESLERCEFSSSKCLPQELSASEVSGRRYRSDKRAASVLSGRTGHGTEFVQSVLPPGLIAVDEAARSALSDVIAARAALVASELPPHRRGLPSEIVASGVSGRRVLRDEVRKSAMSDALALPEELCSCDFSGAMVLPSELIVSDVSGKKCRADETLSSVLSERRGHASEFVRSVAPRGWIAPDEATRSAVSGEWGARSMMTASSRPPHRLGHEHEVVRCELTGQLLLRDEVAPSAVSGKLVDSSLLVPSAASGQKALAEELVACEVTGRRLLPNELRVCSITRKRVDARELRSSKLSGLPGLKSLMVRSAESGARVLPSELISCARSGEMVLESETQQCAISGRRAVARLMKRCPASGACYIDDELSRGQMRELTGSEELLTVSQWSGRQILSHLVGRCTITGLRVEHAELNQAGELSVLRRLLDGTSRDGDVASQPLPAESMEWLRSTRPELRHAQDGVACTSQNGRTVIACTRVKSGLLGLTSTYYAIAARIGRPPTLLCDPVPGKRAAGGWVRLGR